MNREKRNRKRILTALITACTLCVACGFVACKKDKTPDSSSSIEAPATNITLNETMLEMDVYEKIQLTADVQNSTSTVVWASSDESVASVQNGVVSAIKEGTATITATVDGVSATCTVVVTNSLTAPTMSLSYNSIAVALDGTFTVKVNTLWKGEELDEPVSYQWAVVEGESELIASVTPSSDGKSVVVKGLDLGETAYTVTTNVRGFTLTQTLSVKVNDASVRFDLQNVEVDGNGYVANMGLTQTNTLPSSVDTAVKIYKNDAVLADTADIIFSGEDEGIASVSNGVITPVGEGTVTYLITYGKYSTSLTVNVVRPTINMNNVYVLETMNAAFTLEEPINGTVSSVTIDDVDAFSSYASATNTVNLTASSLPTTVEEGLGSNKELVINTDRAQYIGEINVYTQILNTEEELRGFKTASSTGYFVLGNDITCTQTWTDGSAFTGILDGNGYGIYNVTLGARFMNGSKVTVKNISFVNVTNPGYTMFDPGNGSTLSDIYISTNITDNGKTWGSSSSAIGGDLLTNCVHKNIIVEYLNRLPENAVSGYPYYNGNKVNTNNIYAVGVSKMHASGSVSGMAAYADWAAMKAAGNDYSAFNAEFWDIIDGLPVPKKLDNALFQTTIAMGGVEVGTVKSYEATGAYLNYTLDEQAVSNGLNLSVYGVVVPNAATLKSFTLTATSWLDTSKTESVTVGVYSLEAEYQAKADEINAMITALPEASSLTAGNKDSYHEAIVNARVAVTNAVPRVQAKLTNLDKLNACEKAMIALNNGVILDVSKSTATSLFVNPNAVGGPIPSTSYAWSGTIKAVTKDDKATLEVAVSNSPNKDLFVQIILPNLDGFDYVTFDIYGTYFRTDSAKTIMKFMNQAGETTENYTPLPISNTWNTIRVSTEVLKQYPYLCIGGADNEEYYVTNFVALSTQDIVDEINTMIATLPEASSLTAENKDSYYEAIVNARVAVATALPEVQAEIANLEKLNACESAMIALNDGVILDVSKSTATSLFLNPNDIGESVPKTAYIWHATFTSNFTYDSKTTLKFAVTNSGQKDLFAKIILPNLDGFDYVTFDIYGTYIDGKVQFMNQAGEIGATCEASGNQWNTIRVSTETLKEYSYLWLDGPNNETYYITNLVAHTNAEP